MSLWFRVVYPCMLYIGPLDHSRLHQIVHPILTKPVGYCSPLTSLKQYK
uniref:Uncharacterized protein n=1 Tax=Arundo donax TaxID=35708 RepID=A0A0A9BSL6_ARUDO